jgi:hypothetical protein
MNPNRPGLSSSSNSSTDLRLRWFAKNARPATLCEWACVFDLSILTQRANRLLRRRFFGRCERRAHYSRIGFTEWPHENQTPAKFRGYQFLVFSTQKGMTMRIFIASATVATVCLLGTPAFVLAQGAPSQSETTPPAESSTAIRSIEVVDVKDLKPAIRSKVDDIVAHTSDEDLQSLRKSIDATPAAASALKAKGLSSSQVVAINIADGVLMLFAKTA